MASTASSLVKVSTASRVRLGAALAAHVFSGAAGGAVAGFALGAIGSSAPNLLRAALAGVVVVAGLWDLSRRALTGFQPRHGVPAAWREWSPFKYLSAYGFVLGVGMLTPYTAAGMYALIASVLLIADGVVGALCFGAYGLTRALVPIVAAAFLPPAHVDAFIGVAQSSRRHLRLVVGMLALSAAVAFLA